MRDFVQQPTAHVQYSSITGHPDFLDAHRPFRRYIRRLSLRQSLLAIWCYSLHVTNNQQLNAGVAKGLPEMELLQEMVLPWSLEALAREVLLHAHGTGSHNLARWNDLARALNYLQDLDSVGFKVSGAEILDEFHRIAHQQFPSQNSLSMAQITRALKIYGGDDVDHIVQREVGMSMRQLLQLGMAVEGHFMHTPFMAVTYDYSEVFGISREASREFFLRISASVENLRRDIASGQSLDHNWQFSWNPLENTPLVRVQEGGVEAVMCPIPSLLRRRINNGLFYDLIRVREFQNPFGRAFERYVGEVLSLNCGGSSFTLRKQEPYYVKKGQRHDGVDWILSDSSGHLFIEAKTKRLSLRSKTRLDDPALESDLKILAEAITQNYCNIRDALAGITSWKPDSLPIFPLVLTLDDWYLISPNMLAKLDANLTQMMAAEGLPESLLRDHPYTAASIAELEVVSQVMARLGIAAIMGSKIKAEKEGRGSMLLPHVQTHYPDAIAKTNTRLFREEFLSLKTDSGPPPD